MLKRIKARIIRLAVIALVLLSGITLPASKVLAQTARCDDPLFPGYSFGWRVMAGTISGTNVVTGNLYQNPIDVQLVYDSPVYISTLQLTSYMNLLAIGSVRQVNVILYDAGGNIVDQVWHGSSNPGTWERLDYAFDPTLQTGHPIARIDFQFYSLFGFPAETLDAGIHVVSICTIPVLPDGPTTTATIFANPSLTPVIPTFTPTVTRTPTNTLTPSNTPTPVWTPTASDTPTTAPTITPGGPTLTDTPVATNTSIASATSVSTIGPVNSTLSAGLYSTIVPPNSACSDIANPCGALPAVPNFPTISLPSPPPITAVALLPTSTLMPPGTTTPGTPGGTATPGTGTPTMSGTENINPLSTIVDGYNSSLGTLVSQATGSFEIAGTPQSITGLVGTVSTNAGTFIGYVKGIGLIAQNKVMQLVLYLLLLVVLILLVELLVFFVPLIIRVIEFVINLIKLIPFV